ncbi:MAG: hypothetical protein AAFN78_00940 [Pseudomonadota bacterium]
MNATLNDEIESLEGVIDQQEDGATRTHLESLLSRIAKTEAALLFAHHVDKLPEIREIWSGDE